MKYKAVIFDLDGTLVGTDPEHRYTIVGRTLEELQVEAENHLIDKFWFQGNRNETIRKSFHVDPDNFWSVYNKFDDLELRRKFTKPYPDISFVKELQEAGFKIGIVTGAPEHIAKLEIGMIGEQYFDSVIIAGHTSSILSKPHPASVFLCLKELGVNPEETIFVGNGDEDVLAAQNAGVKDVLIDRGEHEVNGVNPTHEITSLFELRKILGL